MAQFDAFNGDADGICALHQARLAKPVDSKLVTGVKRDIALLRRVDAQAGDAVLALDISLDKNLQPLMALLDAGVPVQYVDHHKADGQPDHPGLSATIDTSPATNTSLLMDGLVGGRWPGWAVVGAFGDNLDEVARARGAEAGLSEADLDVLRRLGTAMNYNAYGATVEDLHIAPDALYRRVAAFTDPLAFVEEDDCLAMLESGYEEDMARARTTTAEVETERVSVLRFPAETWARRVGGVYANALAREAPGRAHALLTALDEPQEDGGEAYVVSVRAPLHDPRGADELCSSFPTGGGRKAAAGINRLAAADVDRFIEALAATYG